MKGRFPGLYDNIGWLKGRYLLVLGLLAVAVVVVVTLLIAFGVERHECAVAGGQIHRPTSYHATGGGCYVGLGNGQKVPLDNYNAFKEAK